MHRAAGRAVCTCTTWILKKDRKIPISRGKKVLFFTQIFHAWTPKVYPPPIHLGSPPISIVHVNMTPIKVKYLPSYTKKRPFLYWMILTCSGLAGGAVVNCIVFGPRRRFGLKTEQALDRCQWRSPFPAVSKGRGHSFRGQVVRPSLPWHSRFRPLRRPRIPRGPPSFVVSGLSLKRLTDRGVTMNYA